MPSHPTTAPHPPAAQGTGTGTAPTPAPTPAPAPGKSPAQETATDVVRWSAFSCVLVPVVLVGYGTSLAGAAGTALGLAAVTGACRVLLRRSERGAEHLRAAERTPHHGQHARADAGRRHGGRHAGGNTPVD
ncbi:hypothetical protein [Streptomyces sp. DSM 40484]|uniref:hypothetical protein n=1 Tax=Streptomyces kroppenstedtii TaxID=3051181 RepID=UPI0028D623EC|nr:hypothetical protein [Streptomyces sp. DSM 40484]